MTSLFRDCSKCGTELGYLDHGNLCPDRARAKAPQRIQLRRTRGWRKPENTVVVSRPSKWGNPFSISKEDGDWIVVSCLPKDLAYEKYPVVIWKCDARNEATAKAVELFSEAIAIGDLGFLLSDVRQELRGKNLACWCPPGSPCHADVLLRVANGGAP